MENLRILYDEQEEWSILEKCIRRMGTNLKILEAGCGRHWPLRLEGVNVTLVGIDADADAIAMRTDLTTAIVGDICEGALAPKASFDVVYNSYVLEHVRGAAGALRNLIEWARPGGLVILRIPDRYSAYGAATRLTPLWVHVLYKRVVMGFKESGEPGFGPYPTYHEPIISRRGIEAFCASHNCQVLDSFAHGYYLTYRGGGIAKYLAMAIWLLSFGRFSWQHNDLTFVIQRAV